MGIEYAPRPGTRPTSAISIRCRPGALTGRQNTDNNQMHRAETKASRGACLAGQQDSHHPLSPRGRKIAESP